MPDLTPSRSAPTATTEPIKTGTSRTRSNTGDRPRLSRVFSAGYLDDVSNYHDGEHESKYHDEGIESGESDSLEKVEQEDDAEARDNGIEQVPEVRMGIRDTRDLEANLEKKETTKPTKDPNLV